MYEKLKSNVAFALNILWTLGILGGLAMGYGQTKGTINKLAHDQNSIEKRQDHQRVCITDIQKDLKEILAKVSRIEGKISRF